LHIQGICLLVNKKTKILYLITGLNTGGAEMMLKDLTLGLDREKFEVAVISIAPIGRVGEMIKKDGVRVLSLNVGFKYNPLIIWRLFQVLRKEKPDILHTHLFHADILGRIVGKLAGVPKIITTIHNINIGGAIREFIIRVTKNFVDYNIAVSNIVAENAIEKKMADKRKLALIYNGVDLQNFPIKNKSDVRAKLKISQNKTMLVSVGSLTKQKGYNYLLDAVKEINSDFLFFILGEGPERRALEEKIAKDGLAERVILTGNVTNVNDYLQAADVFVMPSLWEGFSIALLEAAASKKIVVATDVGGNSEIIQDGKNGFLIKPREAEVLAKKIEYVLDLSEEEKKKIEERVRKTIEENFSIDKMVRKYANLYSKLISNSL